MTPLKSKYHEKILEEIKDLSEKQISNLLKIVHIFKESIIYQRNEDLELKKELGEWDKLSDEALLDFEKSL